jgi:hypothetical protein
MAEDSTGMSCFVAELDAEGKVVMVEKVCACQRWCSRSDSFWQVHLPPLSRSLFPPPPHHHHHHQQAIGEATRGGLDDYRSKSKDNRINPGGGDGGGGGGVAAPTTVLAAASTGDLGALKVFLDGGGDPDQAMPRTGTTALMLAAHKGHADCVQCLLVSMVRTLPGRMTQTGAFVSLCGRPCRQQAHV